MAQIDLGKLKFTWKGTWTTQTAYEVDDVVEYDGSTFICIADLNASNTSTPKDATASFQYMQTGLAFKSGFSATVTYYKGDVITYNSQTFVCTAGGGNYNQTIQQKPAPYDGSSDWMLLTPAPANNVLTTSGDLVVRDKDNATNTRLPVGTKGQVLRVAEAPNHDIPNDTVLFYSRLVVSNSHTATLLHGTDFPPYETKTYVVTVAAASSGGGNKFYLDGVEAPYLYLRANSVYVFDVSDASNQTHELDFAVSIHTGTVKLSDQDGGYVTRSGNVGTANATVTLKMPPYAEMVTGYYCTAHSAMGSTIDSGHGGSSGYGNYSGNVDLPTIYTNITNSGPTARKLVKGKSYTFQFSPTAAQRNYAVKDTNDSAYNQYTIGGAVTDGVSPSQVNTTTTAGGFFTFTVPETVATSLVIEDFSGGTDGLPLQIIDRTFLPTYTGGDFAEKNVLTSIKDNYRERTSNILQFNNYPCMFTNTYTESIKPLPEYLKKAGRGLGYGGFSGLYRQYGFLAQREYMGGGNMWQNGSYDYTYGGGMGYDGQDCASGTRWYPSAGSRVQGYKLRQALAGNPDYAHLLTDLNGNDCGMLDANGNIRHRFPRIMQVHGNRSIKYFLYENGMVWFAGYNGYGLMGDGGTRDRCPAQSPMKWYDESTSELKGTNYPKIKQLVTTHGHTQDTSSYDYGSTYAVDTEGYLYSWGYNGYGQLGDGTTNGNYYAKRVPKSVFNDEKILYVMCSGYRYTHTMVITESGKCWSTGYGDQGQLGLNNTSSRSDFAEVTAVNGSPLNGKKIIHILMNQDGDAEGRTWWLTEDGEVYYAGYFRDYGQQTGVYDSNGSGTNGMPRILTNSSTLWNSDNQKVIYMASTNNRYSTLWFITDGGTTGLSQKIYATASNYHGVAGHNIQPNNHTNDPAQGAGWFGGEILFSDFGDYEDGGDNNRPNEAIGNWSSFQDGGSNEKKMKIGKIVEIIPRGTPENTYNSVVLVDEHGSLFICGYWNYTPSRASENDNQHYIRYQDHWVPYFIHWPDQPAQILAGGFTHTGNGTENGWFIMTKDGNVLQGGDNSWYQRGNYNDSGYSSTPPSWATLDTNG